MENPRVFTSVPIRIFSATVCATDTCLLITNVDPGCCPYTKTGGAFGGGFPSTWSIFILVLTFSVKYSDGKKFSPLYLFVSPEYNRLVEDTRLYQNTTTTHSQVDHTCPVIATLAHIHFPKDI